MENNPIILYYNILYYYISINNVYYIYINLKDYPIVIVLGRTRISNTVTYIILNLYMMLVKYFYIIVERIKNDFLSNSNYK